MIGKERFLRVLFFAMAVLAGFSTTLKAQGTHTARPLGSTTSPYGYYEYLPIGYDKNNNKYPILIFLHGLGEKGNGTTNLPAAIKHGPGKEIEKGRDFPFIVVSPQSTTWWNYGTIDTYIDWLKTKYRVDVNRIYMTGLSMGGISTYRYAASYPNQLAAIVPIAGEAQYINSCNFSHIPLWAFHGDADGVVSYHADKITVDEYNNCTPKPSPIGKFTTYPGVGHDSWTMTYDGSAGHDIYTWMLQFSKTGGTPPANAAPTANAGSDKTITLPTASLTLSGSASDSDGSIAAKSWTKVSGPAATLTNTTSLNLQLSALVEGSYTFRLTVTDNDGATASDDVKVTVNPLVDGGNRGGNPNAYLVNFNSSNPASAPWNNFSTNPHSGRVINNLKAEDGTASAIRVKLSSPWSGAIASGSTTGNNSGVFADAAMLTSYWTNDAGGETIEISGLDASSTYDLSMFASREASDTRTTIYSAGGKTASLVVSNNTSNTATLSSVRPSTGGVITLSVSLANGNSFAYLGALKITDNSSSSSSSPPTQTALYNINFNDGNSLPSPWNNFNSQPGTGFKLTNLKDTEGQPSTIGVELMTPWGYENGSSGYNSGGMETGNNSGVYPDKVLTNGYWTAREDGEQIKVYGLDPNVRYSFTFVGSRNAGGDRTTVYKIGSSTVSLSASYNTAASVNIQGVQPNSNGEIVITIEKGANSSYGYLNGMTIQAGSSASTESRKSSTALAAPDTQVENLSFTAYPNPTTDFITVEFGEGFSQEVLVEMYNLAGHAIISKTYTTDEASLRLDLSSSSIKEGMYILKIKDGDKTYTNRIIKN
jgi:predicted esterase